MRGLNLGKGQYLVTLTEGPRRTRRSHGRGRRGLLRVPIPRNPPTLQREVRAPRTLEVRRALSVAPRGHHRVSQSIFVGGIRARAGRGRGGGWGSRLGSAHSAQRSARARFTLDGSRGRGRLGPWGRRRAAHWTPLPLFPTLWCKLASLLGYWHLADLKVASGL